ncbi:hypothetical protein POM88_036167 [Heracleum sosnowskyi]|uniref:Uncharacterized protein n=1 Tax=Heracleum sosnowskyi TaxID=360622 RepID=A0AAD8HQ02_9APIA|nr:hypothetical protein POM88_036167 [Heracleum sosnowskyi]
MTGKERGNDYEFPSTVHAIVDNNKRVNLIGVVIEEILPNPGFNLVDYHRSITEIDFLTSGLPFRCDARHMNTHGSEVYALFSKKYSSFSMYKRKQGENFVTYQAS